MVHVIKKCVRNNAGLH